MHRFKVFVDKIGLLYCSLLNQFEFRRQKFAAVNERPIEYGFVFNSLASLHPKSVLDVGSGLTALPSLMRSCGFLVTAIDNIKDYWSFGMVNRHYHVVNSDVTKQEIKEKYDVITCISVLEHIVDHKSAMKVMSSMLSPNGHLILTCPYTEDSYNSNVYEDPGSNAYGKKIAFKTQSFSGKNLQEWCSEAGLEIVTQEYWKCFSGKYWTVGDRVIPARKASSSETHQLSCILLKKTH